MSPVEMAALNESLVVLLSISICIAIQTNETHTAELGYHTLHSNYQTRFVEHETLGGDGDFLSHKLQEHLQCQWRVRVTGGHTDSEVPNVTFGTRKIKRSENDLCSSFMCMSIIPFGSESFKECSECTVGCTFSWSLTVPAGVAAMVRW